MRIIHSLKYVFGVFPFSFLQKNVSSFIYGSVSDKFPIKQFWTRCEFMHDGTIAYNTVGIVVLVSLRRNKRLFKLII